MKNIGLIPSIYFFLYPYIHITIFIPWTIKLQKSPGLLLFLPFSFVIIDVVLPKVPFAYTPNQRIESLPQEGTQCLEDDARYM